MLLGCSVGCVSLKHHVRQHSLVGVMTESHQGRYYHCSHCGQILPREGFSKCPRCMQVPAYHGYEPTCWRQWPAGWGCPPEHVAGQAEFWTEGMVESDAVSDTPPAAEVDQSEDVQLPPAEVAPDDSGASMPQPHGALAQVEPLAQPAEEPAPAAPLHGIAELPLPDSAADAELPAAPLAEIATAVPATEAPVTEQPPLEVAAQDPPLPEPTLRVIADQAPLPIRKVQLANAELTRADADTAVALADQGDAPRRVKRIVLPTPTPASASSTPPGDQDEVKFAPVRRIPLSELPFRLEP